MFPNAMIIMSVKLSRMKIYIDTGAFFALSDSRDRFHRRASAYARQTRGVHRFVTSSYVVVESWLLIRNKLGYNAALDFLERVRRGGAQVVEVNGDDLDQSAKILATWSDQQFSLVDAVSFVLMERLNVETVFSFDEHFRVYRYGAKRERSFRVVP
jgi:uncharacterized protein